GADQIAIGVAVVVGESPQLIILPWEAEFRVDLGVVGKASVGNPVFELHDGEVGGVCGSHTGMRRPRRAGLPCVRRAGRVCLGRIRHLLDMDRARASLVAWYGLLPAPGYQRGPGCRSVGVRWSAGGRDRKSGLTDGYRLLWQTIVWSAYRHVWGGDRPC